MGNVFSHAFYFRLFDCLLHLFVLMVPWNILANLNLVIKHRNVVWGVDVWSGYSFGIILWIICSVFILNRWLFFWDQCSDFYILVEDFPSLCFLSLLSYLYFTLILVSPTFKLFSIVWFIFFSCSLISLILITFSFIGSCSLCNNAQLLFSQD